MNVLSAHSPNRTLTARAPQPRAEVAAHDEDTFTPSHRDPMNLIIGGITTALPVVGTFGHISLEIDSKGSSAVSTPAKIGMAANLLGTVALAANFTFLPSTALTVASIACLAASGVAGAVATANLPTSPLQA